MLIEIIQFLIWNCQIENFKRTNYDGANNSCLFLLNWRVLGMKFLIQKLYTSTNKSLSKALRIRL